MYAMDTANLTCPKCGHKQEVEIPEDTCLPFYKCGQCHKVISVPKDSKNCCVICEYSDKKCPVAQVT
ncbi:hypothetical protein CL652_00015 [bacterium]|nr:hypothetical protein [bacterium]